MNELEERKKQLVRESDALRSNLQVQVKRLEPYEAAFERAYALGCAGNKLWNMTSPLRAATQSKWLTIPKTIFKVLRERFSG